LKSPGDGNNIYSSTKRNRTTAFSKKVLGG
jgi:hypothetical protein